ncbi:MAG: 4Fe-4S dicluster domain-containing protein [Chloroflexota bacterium]|nr:4Fe-4S dicluster domain-containing protein [Chloroflexota bacterium]
MSASKNTQISRRGFLKRVGTGTAAAFGLAMLPQQALSGYASGDSESHGPTWSLLIDLTRCTGCDSCALACKASNELPDADVVPSALDADTYTFVEEHQVTKADGTTVTRYVKRQCMHCLDASCVSACPAAAMHNSGEGPVIYRADRCLGCRYCQVACPFEIPRFDWDNGLTPKISKCWMCFEGLQEGQLPACVEACPTGALRFGRRDDLLAQAHAQIASNPARYIDHVYGENEVGGTSVLYLSDVPFEQLGFVANLPDTAPAQETEKIMSKLPTVIAGMTALMAGSAFITHRKPAEPEDIVPEALVVKEEE